MLSGAARWCVVEGDALDVVRALPAACVDALVTDPPSGIAFMGAEWDRDRGGRAQWCAWLASILGHVRAATRDGGRALVWSLPRTSHWTGCAVEDAGWSIESTVTHLFGTGWPKGASQLKPAAETWWLARTGRSAALNIDACRVGTSKRVPWSLSTSALNGYGVANRSGQSPDDDAHNPSIGRYPPNVVFSHAPGCVCVGERRVVTERPHARRGTSPAPMSWGAARADVDVVFGHADPDGTELVEAWECVEGCPVRELDAQSGELHPPGNLGGTPRDGIGYGGASRFFPQFPADEDALFGYYAKPSRTEKNAGLDALPQNDRASVAPVASNKVMRCAECRRTHPMTYHGACKRCGADAIVIDDAADDGSGRDGCRVHANTHPTVKSIALMRWLVRLVTRPGDVVLDPFGGSGTTGVAALAEGRRVILVERDPRFAEIARQRLTHATPDLTAPVRVPARAATPARAPASQLELFEAAR